MQLTHLLLRQISPAFVDAGRREMPGFRFDMNTREQSVARLCREFAPTGWTIDTQDTTREAYTFRFNPQRWQRPPLRPDVVVRERGRARLVIDTKYKDLGGSRLGAADLYQLTLYSMVCGEGQPILARLLYPVETVVPPETLLDFVGFRGGSALGRVVATALPLEPLAQAIRRRDSARLRDVVQALLIAPSL